MSRLAALVLGLVALASVAVAAGAPPNPRAFQLMDVLRLQWAADPQMSHDGPPS